VNFRRTFTTDTDSPASNPPKDSTPEKPTVTKKTPQKNTDGQFDLFATPGTGAISMLRGNVRVQNN